MNQNHGTHQRYPSMGAEAPLNFAATQPLSSHLLNSDFDEGAQPFSDYPTNNGVYSQPLTQRSSYQWTSGSNNHLQMMVGGQQVQNFNTPNDNNARRKQLSIDISRNYPGGHQYSHHSNRSIQDEQSNHSAMMKGPLLQGRQAPQHVPRGVGNNLKNGQDRGYQGLHVAKKKSIVSQVSSSSGSSSYKPSNLGNMFQNREAKKSIGSNGGDAAKFDNSGISSSNLGQRSKSISSSQNDGAAVSEKSISQSNYHIKTNSVSLAYPNMMTPGGPVGKNQSSTSTLLNLPVSAGGTKHHHVSQSYEPPRDWNDIVDSDQFYGNQRSQFLLKESPLGINDQQVLMDSPYYQSKHDIDAQYIQRGQRIDQLTQKQASQTRSSIDSNSQQQPMSSRSNNQSAQTPSYYNVQQPGYNTNQQQQMYPPQQAPSYQFQHHHLPMNVIQPIVIQQNPSFHQNSNQQYYQYFPGHQQQFNYPHHMQNVNMPQQVIGGGSGPMINTQQQTVSNGTPTQIFETMQRQPSIQASSFSSVFPTTTCHQLQTSNSSSSGNISSSWLSQSQSSQNNQLSSQPTLQQNSPPCQCTDCLKAQMAYLQQMLQQQQQLFLQQAPNYNTQLPIPTSTLGKTAQIVHNSPKIHQSAQQTPLNQPTNQHQPPPSSSFCTSNNQSSSVWASSQISPQSSSQQSVAVMGVSTSLNHSDSNATTEKQQLSSSVKKKRQVITKNSNIDEQDESAGSGSIPDEIDQQSLYMDNKAYQEELTMQRIMNEYVDTSSGGQQVFQYQVKGQYVEGSDENNPYWAPVQAQQQQNTSNQGNTMRKNYIELPLGEIPEMKESFYDEASRWSQVFATANQSRTKTPDVMTSQSQQNLHSEQTMTNKGAESQTSQMSKQQYEEDKEELFLYSQGESGATLNRSENESSFLTSEKNKINQCLQNDFVNYKRGGGNDESSPSFEVIRELSINKSHETHNDNKLPHPTETKLTSLTEAKHASLSNTKQPQFKEYNNPVIRESNQSSNSDMQMMYPSSTDTKRPPLEYSASSAKYYQNQSLTFTPSQYGGGQEEDNVMSIEKKNLNIHYDQMTPVKNGTNKRHLEQESEDYEKAYSYLTSQQLTTGAGMAAEVNEFKESCQQINLREQFKDCKILDEDLTYQRSSINGGGSLPQSEKDCARRINDQREILLSPLPPLPFSADPTTLGTPEGKTNQKVRNQPSIGSHFSSTQVIIVDQNKKSYNPQSRAGSLSYEKDKATKIINYILNSDQKKSGHHTMKSSILSRGFHRPNVMSQVNNIFPSLEDLLGEPEKTSLGLRTQKNADSFPSSRTGFHLSMQTAPSVQPISEDVNIWSASLASKPDIEESYINQKQQKLSQEVVFAAFHTTTQGIQNEQQIMKKGNLMKVSEPSLTLQTRKETSNKIRVIDVKDPKIQPIPAWQSRNVKSRTQNLPTTTQVPQKITQNSTGGFDNLLQASQRFRSVDNQKKQLAHSDERIAHNVKISSEIKRPSLEKKISPFDRQSKLTSSQLLVSNSSVFGSNLKSSRRTEEGLTQSQKSFSPYYGGDGRIQSQRQGVPSLSTQLLQSQAFAEQMNQVTQKNKKQIFLKRPLGSAAITVQKSSYFPTKTTPITRFSPTVFDRLTNHQLALNHQKSAKEPEGPYFLEDIIQQVPQSNQPIPSRTARNDSIKSRPSVERIGGDTRNSSCSSGANTRSGGPPRKRKFSKIVFEISELPSVSMINRSLSNKRTTDQLNIQNLGVKNGTANVFQRRQDNQVIHIHRDLQKAKGGLINNPHKSSISPKRMMDHLNVPTKYMSTQPQHTLLESTNRSYNSNSDFIVTHENFQIRQMTTEETSLANELGFTQNLKTEESSRNQPRMTQAQSEIVRNQYFQTEPDTSKAIVQSLLNNNEHVSTQLSRLFGQKIMSKNSSILSDLNIGDESQVQYGSTRVVVTAPTQIDISQRSPMNAYPTRQKQLSPNYRTGRQNEESKKLIPSSSQLSITQQQQSKICLPNAIFFNQTQKLNLGTNSTTQSKLMQTQQIVRKPGAFIYGLTKQANDNMVIKRPFQMTSSTSNLRKK